MIQELEKQIAGVTCLRCGMLNLLEGLTDSDSGEEHGSRIHFPLLIVRCSGCGKEASYLAEEVIGFKPKPSAFRTAA